jgi:threonine synthase
MSVSPRQVAGHAVAGQPAPGLAARGALAAGTRPPDSYGGVPDASSALVCTGCLSAPPAIDDDPFPFRCRRATELPDVDHVIRLVAESSPHAVPSLAHANPFVRHRSALYAYRAARAHGMADADYVDLVNRLDERVAQVCGTGFTVTPLMRSRALEMQLGMEPSGAVWIKDETVSVAGSHKARHLMGIMLYLRVVEALGLAEGVRTRELAIASCGNAAVAAAVIARAAGYVLRVFVPVSADPALLAQMADLGAVVEVCSRVPGVPGDPSLHRFRSAVAQGALPFCCQGPENGLTIDGGKTLWLEALETLVAMSPESVFVQVGGGALATACVQACSEAVAAGHLKRLPRLYAVQTRGSYPLAVAYREIRKTLVPGSSVAQIAEVMRHARTHRSSVMRPWPTEPHGVAAGLLDDEAYDWAAVVEGALRSGGDAIVVDDGEVVAANRMAVAATASLVDYTGSAGLAGLAQTLRRDASARRAHLLVVFSGRQRSLR